MSETEAKATKERQLRVHTQHLVAITSVAKDLGWEPGDPIELQKTRTGNVVIISRQDPAVLKERADKYHAAGAAKEAEKKAKADAKKAAEAKTKEEKEAAKAAAAAAEKETPEVKTP